MIANQELELNFYWLFYYGAKPGYNCQAQVQVRVPRPNSPQVLTQKS